jgi:hypothetical protein
MPGLATTTALVLGALGIGSATALDVAIDRSGHDHDSPAYRWGSAPTRSLVIGGAALVAAGIGASLVPGARAAAPTLVRLGVGTLAAWGATFAVRLGVGMLFDPRDGGMRFDPGDIARNSIDRVFMMGHEPNVGHRVVFGAVSRLQGHGGYEERLARGDFVPKWREGDPPPTAPAR